MSGLGDILILGLGQSGRAAAMRASDLVDATRARSVTAVDQADTPALRAVAAMLSDRGVRVVLGADSVDTTYDLCVASPGIPPASALFGSARSASSRVVSELEFAYMLSTQQWVAVTGTNGKTTTTALLTHLLESGGLAARAVGNFGPPAADAVAGARPEEILVAEVSSFQLAFIETFHPKVAVLLNITPDHIDWHGSLGEYASAKARIFENLGPDDLAVIDVDNEGSAPYADTIARRGIPVVRVSLGQAHAGGATAADGVLTLQTRGGRVRLVPAAELRILGEHNVSNALAAAAAAHAMGVGPERIREGLRSFEPIEHRLEPVGIVGEAEWFNDSKATNPDAVLKALTAFGDRPLVILLGGHNKGNDFRALAQRVSARAHVAILFGESRRELSAAFSGLSVRLLEAVSFNDAVEVARAVAEPGDVVLLSPACASFDEFRSYEERGEAFKALVAEMAGER